MKRIIIIIITSIIIISCNSNVLEKEYDKTSNKVHLKEIEKLISKDDYLILKEYILALEKQGDDLSHTTYLTLLNDAKEAHSKKLQKIEEEKRIEKERIEKEKLTELLCHKEWKAVEYGVLIKIPNESLETIDKAKKLLETSFALIGENDKFRYSVEENYRGLFLKATYNETLRRMLFGKNRRIKKYNLDRTFIDYAKNESSIKGKWNLINLNTISEEMPSGWTKAYKFHKNLHMYDITILNKDTLSYFRAVNKGLIIYENWNTAQFVTYIH